MIRGLIFLIFFNYSTNGQTVKTEVAQKNIYSLKMRGLYGIFYQQYIINPNLCINKVSDEFSFGIYYRKTNFEYISNNFKRLPAKANYFGINIGYVRCPYMKKRLSILFESNVLIAIINTQYIENNVQRDFKPVYIGLLNFGPFLNYKLNKKIQINLLYQISLGHGISLNPNYSDPKPIGANFYLELIPYLEIKIKL